MIRVKIDKNRKNEPIFKLNFKSLLEGEEKLFKRILMESSKIKGNFKYEVPLRYLYFILTNIDKDRLIIDGYSKLYFYEFSDTFDDKYFYTFEISPKYMKKWREEGCPQIFKINIDKESQEITKEVVFKRVQIVGK